MITGNIIEDITGHFANYLICMNNIPTSGVEVPHTRLYTDKNYDLFKKTLLEADWDCVYNSDVNNACNCFHDIATAHDSSFPLVKISNRGQKDKNYHKRN